MVHYKIEKLLKIPQHEQRSPEWFAQRYTKLTSSDAATVLNLNPYSKPYELLFKKCGYDPKPFISNVATLHGQKYEDTAIELYCQITGKVNHNFGCICYTDVHKEFNHYKAEYDFLAGSPDGIAESLHDPTSEPILLEVKCPYRRKITDGYIPAYYYPQVQLNLFICDLSIADFIEFCPKTNRLNIVRIAKDYNWINTNVIPLIQFWNDVEYYREIGIENHSEYIKKQERLQKRQERLEKKEKEKLEKAEKTENNKAKSKNNKDTKDSKNTKSKQKVINCEIDNMEIDETNEERDTIFSKCMIID